MVERIRLLLETRQLSPTQFADAIGIARPIVSHILSGRNKPSLDVVQRILAAMPDLSMPWLLNGTGTMLAGTASPPAAQPTYMLAPVMPVEPPAVPPVVAQDEPLPTASVPSLAEVVVKPPINQIVGAAAPSPSAFTPPVPKSTGATRPTPRRFTAPPPRPAAANAALAPESLPAPAPEVFPTLGEMSQTPAAAAELVSVAAMAAPPSIADDEPAADATAAALFVGEEKPIRRIVIFYRDGSFADYQPE